MWKQYWEQRRFVFAPEYVAFIEGIRSRAGTRPYRPLGVSPDHNIEDKKARTAGGDAQQPVAADGEA
jgi:hypothetical protein